MTTMNARYAGRCVCAGTFGRGAVIEYDRALRRVVACPSCNPDAAAVTPAWVPERKRPRYQSTYTRFSSGAEVFTNKRGRCEDAPCCGCCS